MTSEIVTPLVTSFANPEACSIYFWDEGEKAWYFTSYVGGTAIGSLPSTSLKQLTRLHARLNELSASASEEEIMEMLSAEGIRSSHQRTLAVAAWKFEAEIRGLPERAKLEERIKRLLPNGIFNPLIMRFIDNYSQHQKPSDGTHVKPLKEPEELEELEELETQISTQASLPGPAPQLDLF